MIATTNPVIVRIRGARVRFDDGNAALKRLERAGVVVLMADDDGLHADCAPEQLREIMRAIDYTEEDAEC